MSEEEDPIKFDPFYSIDKEEFFSIEMPVTSSFIKHAEE
jgi:hypothetical protein